jgi:cytochrome c oxidase assembly protein subunit 15
MGTLARRGDSALTSHAVSNSVWPHRLAVLTASATLPLLFIGGLVTSKGAGLAVPDWPTTFGYNMFLYPWSQMVGAIFYEHSHRLAGSFVGLCTIFLALALWFKEPRRWLRWLGLAALAMVIVQGVLGGLRVILLQHTLAVIHASLAQTFFAFAVGLAVFTSPEWRGGIREAPLDDGGKLARLGIITTVMIYLQVIFGAVLRHSGERLDAHLLFALLVAVHVLLLLLRVTKHFADRPRLLRGAVFLGALLAAQLLLGLGSYFAKYTTLLRMPAEGVVYLTTIHLIAGALMLVTSLILTLRLWRLSQAAKLADAQVILREQPSI